MGLLSAAAWGWGVEQARVQLQKTLQGLFQSPVHIQHLTLSPGKAILRHVVIGSDRRRPFLVIQGLQVKGSFLSLIGRTSFLSWERGIRSVTITKLSVLLGSIALQAEGQLFLKQPEKPGPGLVECEGWLDLDHPFVKGRVELSGTVGHPVIFGWIEGFQGIRKRFISQLTLHTDRLELSRMDVEGGWTMDGALIRNETEGAHGVLNMSGPFVKVKLSAPLLSRSSGKLDLWAFVEDHLPFEGTVSWRNEASILKLDLNFPKDELMLTGTIGLSAPHPLHVDIRFSQIDADEVWSLLNPRSPVAPCSGQIEGEISLTGTPDHLISQGEILSRNAELLGQAFQLAALRFRGIGPMIHVQNSELTKSSGVLLMEGEMDLRRLGQPDFFSHMQLSSLEKTLGLAGWQMAPISGQRIGSSGLQVRKAFAENQMGIGLRYEEDPQVNKDPIRRQQVEIDYPLSSQESVNMRVQKDETFVGVEHRKKF